MNTFKAIKNNNQITYVVKSSKFTTYGFYVESNNEIKKIINELNKNNPKAKHICYAYRLTNNEIKIEESTEPSGSSGKKIFEVIQNNNLYNCLIVIIRFMGKSKLGLGLLTRSYFNAANTLITRTQLCDLLETNIYQIETSFNEFNNLINKLIKNNETIFEKNILEGNCKIITTLDNLEIRNDLQPIYKKFIRK